MSSLVTEPHAIVDALLPRQRRSWLLNGALVLFFSAFVALTAEVEIPLWPVPLTLQTLGVLFTGAVLGGRRGTLALLLYLAEGTVGLPVFAGGASGVAQLLGPTGGYLVGFVVAAGVVGWLAERGWDRRLVWTVLTMLVVRAPGGPTAAAGRRRPLKKTERSIANPIFFGPEAGSQGYQPR